MQNTTLRDDAALQRLIAALEKATGPSRELDEEIMCCVYADLKPERHLEGWYSASGDHIQVDHYTASLDAALTLVPEGWEWIVFGAGGADVWKVGNDAVLHRIDETYAATPAIALCIAALRARAAA